MQCRNKPATEIRGPSVIPECSDAGISMLEWNADAGGIGLDDDDHCLAVLQARQGS
jgi:hypothetical protein